MDVVYTHASIGVAATAERLQYCMLQVPATEPLGWQCTNRVNQQTAFRFFLALCGEPCAPQSGASIALQLFSQSVPCLPISFTHCAADIKHAARMQTDKQEYSNRGKVEGSKHRDQHLSTFGSGFLGGLAASLGALAVFPSDLKFMDGFCMSFRPTLFKAAASVGLLASACVQATSSQASDASARNHQDMCPPRCAGRLCMPAYDLWMQTVFD